MACFLASVVVCEGGGWGGYLSVDGGEGERQKWEGKVVEGQG